MIENREEIQMSAAAIRRVAELMCEAEDSNVRLRVYITGGGCSGLQYGFGFEDACQADDTEFAYEVEEGPEGGDKSFWPEKVQVIVDPISLPYLVGSTIDYQESLRGACFTVKNPNAETTCSCGASFSVE